MEQKTKKPSLLDDLPSHLSAMEHCQEIQDRVEAVGFDWNSVDEILLKLNEELDEFKAEHKKGDVDGMLDELGDIFFTLVNIGRHCHLSAEEALRRSNEKFIRRFQAVEKRVEALGKSINSMSFNELLGVWSSVKQREK